MTRSYLMVFKPPTVKARPSISAIMELVLAVVCGMLLGSAEGTALGMRHMVPVRDRQDVSLCRYDVVVDHDPTRIPDRVDKVLCRRDGCKCVEAGDFRCTQLYTQLNVSYGIATGNLQYDALDVELACVCARSSDRTELQALGPDIV